MIVHIRLFAAAKDVMKSEQISLEIRNGATIGELRTTLSAKHPELASITGHSLFAVANDYVGNEHILEDETTVACIPPVSGG